MIYIDQVVSLDGHGEIGGVERVGILAPFDAVGVVAQLELQAAVYVQVMLCEAIHSNRESVYLAACSGSPGCPCRRSWTGSARSSQG